MALHCEIRTVWWDLAFLTNIVEKNFQLFYTYSEGRRPPPRKVKEEVGEWTGAQARGEGGGGGLEVAKKFVNSRQSEFTI